MNAILESTHKDVTLVMPANPLSDLAATAFKSWLEQVLRTTSRIVLDLSNVEYVDSTGCSVLLWLHRQILDVGGRLAICGLTSPVRALFELIRIQRVLDICPSREAALHAIQCDEACGTHRACPSAVRMSIEALNTAAITVPAAG